MEISALNGIAILPPSSHAQARLREPHGIWYEKSEKAIVLCGKSAVKFYLMDIVIMNSQQLWSPRDYRRSSKQNSGIEG